MAGVGVLAANVNSGLISECVGFMTTRRMESLLLASKAISWLFCTLGLGPVPSRG